MQKKTFDYTSSEYQANFINYINNIITCFEKGIKDNAINLELVGNALKINNCSYKQLEILYLTYFHENTVSYTIKDIYAVFAWLAFQKIQRNPIIFSENGELLDLNNIIYRVPSIIEPLEINDYLTNFHDMFNSKNGLSKDELNKLLNKQMNISKMFEPKKENPADNFLKTLTYEEKIKYYKKQIGVFKSYFTRSCNEIANRNKSITSIFYEALVYKFPPDVFANLLENYSKAGSTFKTILDEKKNHGPFDIEIWNELVQDTGYQSINITQALQLDDRKPELNIESTKKQKVSNFDTKENQKNTENEYRNIHAQLIFQQNLNRYANLTSFYQIQNDYFTKQQYLYTSNFGLLNQTNHQNQILSSNYQHQMPHANFSNYNPYQYLYSLNNQAFQPQQAHLNNNHHNQPNNLQKAYAAPINYSQIQADLPILHYDATPTELKSQEHTVFIPKPKKSSERSDDKHISDRKSEEPLALYEGKEAYLDLTGHFNKLTVSKIESVYSEKKKSASKDQGKSSLVKEAPVDIIFNGHLETDLKFKPKGTNSCTKDKKEPFSVSSNSMFKFFNSSHSNPKNLDELPIVESVPINIDTINDLEAANKPLANPYSSMPNHDSILQNDEPQIIAFLPHTEQNNPQSFVLNNSGNEFISHNNTEDGSFNFK